MSRLWNTQTGPSGTNNHVFVPVCTKHIWWVFCQKALLVSSDHRIRSFLKISRVWQLNMLEFVFGWSWPNNMWWCRFFYYYNNCLRLSDPKTQLISVILQLWSLKSLESPHRALGWIYNRMSFSRQIRSIFSWLVEMGIFNAFASLLYLQPLSILRSSTGNLAFVFPHIYTSVKQQVMAGQIHVSR